MKRTDSGQWAYIILASSQPKQSGAVTRCLRPAVSRESWSTQCPNWPASRTRPTNTSLCVLIEKNCGQQRTRVGRQGERRRAEYQYLWVLKTGENKNYT